MGVRPGTNDAFGLTASEAKMEIMCLQTKGWGHVPFTVTAAGQVHKQTVEFVYLGGVISADWDLRSVRGNASTPEGMGMLRAVEDGSL